MSLKPAEYESGNFKLIRWTFERIFKGFFQKQFVRFIINLYCWSFTYLNESFAWKSISSYTVDFQTLCLYRIPWFIIFSRVTGPYTHPFTKGFWDPCSHCQRTKLEEKYGLKLSRLTTFLRLAVENNWAC